MLGNMLCQLRKSLQDHGRQSIAPGPRKLIN